MMWKTEGRGGYHLSMIVEVRISLSRRERKIDPSKAEFRSSSEVVAMETLLK